MSSVHLLEHCLMLLCHVCDWTATVFVNLFALKHLVLSRPALQDVTIAEQLVCRIKVTKKSTKNVGAHIRLQFCMPASLIDGIWIALHPERKLDLQPEILLTVRRHAKAVMSLKRA